MSCTADNVTSCKSRKGKSAGHVYPAAGGGWPGSVEKRRMKPPASVPGDRIGVLSVMKGALNVTWSFPDSVKKGASSVRLLPTVKFIGPEKISAS